MRLSRAAWRAQVAAPVEGNARLEERDAPMDIPDQPSSPVGNLGANHPREDAHADWLGFRGAGQHRPPHCPAIGQAGGVVRLVLAFLGFGGGRVVQRRVRRQ